MLVRIMACDCGARIVWSTFGFRFEVDSPMTEGNWLYNASAEAEFNVKSMQLETIWTVATAARSANRVLCIALKLLGIAFCFLASADMRRRSSRVF
jgi:hypothetical protein